MITNINNTFSPKKQATELQTVLAELKELRADLRASRRKLLTVNETAQVLAMARKTIYNQLSAGTFPIKAHKSAGGVRFRQIDIDTYVDGLAGVAE